MELPVYLDYMATTPVDPIVAEKIFQCLGCFGNPASQTHAFGWRAAKKVQAAREQVARLIQADPREIVWTSGATESDNLAIKGAAFSYQRKGKHIITMSTEHKAVLDTCHYLETEGFEVTYLDPESNGLLSIDKFQAALREDTILVSIMLVNNETGVIQDIAALSALTHNKGIIFHSDCAQAAGKVDINVKNLAVDLLSFSGHKLYGPQGIGALYVRREPRVRLVQQMHGGGHEGGMRSGTLATHQIVGMGAAFHLAKERFSEDHDHIIKLREKLWQGIFAIGGVTLHGDLAYQIPGCINVSFDGVKADAVMLALRDLAISSGSACTSSNPAPSHVLLAMNVTPDAANRALRMSYGRFTTMEEIEFAVTTLQAVISRLRSVVR